MDKIRSGQAEWLRGDIKGFNEEGIIFNLRGRAFRKVGPGKEEVIKGDIVVMATGFQRPSLNFLPDDSFGEPYNPPNWYLQTFPPQHVSVCCNNCTVRFIRLSPLPLLGMTTNKYHSNVNAIGSVGNWHIGIYTRILLMFLSDPLTRPQTSGWSAGST